MPHMNATMNFITDSTSQSIDFSINLFQKADPIVSVEDRQSRTGSDGGISEATTFLARGTRADSCWVEMPRKFWEIYAISGKRNNLNFQNKFLETFCSSQF